MTTLPLCTPSTPSGKVDIPALDTNVPASLIRRTSSSIPTPPTTPGGSEAGDSQPSEMDVSDDAPPPLLVHPQPQQPPVLPQGSLDLFLAQQATSLRNRRLSGLQQPQQQLQEHHPDSVMTVDIPMDVSPSRLEDEPLRWKRDNGLRLRDLEVRGTLGTGTFGRVLLVRRRSSHFHHHLVDDDPHFYALKVLRKTEIVRLRQVEHVNAERYILSRVRHPFIVDLFATFQDSLNVYMLMSYVPGGELFTHLRRAQRFTPDVTRFYLATIILALKYLHSFNIIYRDLKPENLLLDSRGYLRLTDFGFAKIVDDRTWTLCGTPEYLAPEIIQNDGHGKAADWWACGVLCYEMLVGYPPFYDELPYGIYEKILAGNIHWPKSMDPLSKNIVKGFLTQDRTKRLGNMGGGAQDILDHPWFRGVDWGALERREIHAPIIPRTSSDDDTRHFLSLPFPPAEEIPGLLQDERYSSSLASRNRFDSMANQFLEF